MSRGIPIPNEPLAFERMMHAFYEERLKDFKLAQLTALSGMGASADAVVRVLNELKDLFFPNNETEEDILKRNANKIETLEMEEGKTYNVKKVDLPSYIGNKVRNT